jgi:ABC-type antimicrobial peptide transport system permease subunit
LGASYQIGSEVERINVILFAVMLLVSGLYILNTSMVSTLARQREIAIQKALGWKSSSVFTLVLSEGLLAGLAAGLLGLGLAVGLAAAFHLALPLSQALWIPPTGLALCLVGGLAPAVRAARIAPAQILARGEITASRLPTGRLSLPTYAWRQVWQRRSRSSLALSTIAVATALITLFLGITFYLHGYLSGTLLGETILTHIGSVQYLIAAISFLIAGFATADVLLMGVIERKREIGVLKATGWRDRLVFQLFLWEAVGLAASAGILGWLVGSFVLLVAFQVSVLAILGLLVPTLLIPVMVALGAALYPARQAARIPPSEAMRYE